MDVNTFQSLYLFTFIFVGVGFALWFILPVVVIGAWKKKRDKKAQEMFEKAEELRRIREAQIQVEIDMKKMKYKRIKCEYCGSLNKIDAVTCVSCGGELCTKDNGLLAMEEQK